MTTTHHRRERFPAETHLGRLGRRLALSVMFALPLGGAARAQTPACPDAPLLPAYAHNDYANPRPLGDALERGFRGVEVDLFLLRGELVAAHERGAARRGRSLEALYLAPLEALVRRCGRVVPGREPFLLNVELKESSRAAFDSLLALVGRHPELFDGRADGAAPRSPVELVLVGWHPPATALARVLPPAVGLQVQVTDRTRPIDPDPAGLVRLVSLNYGKTVGWSGRGPPPASLREWLAALRRAKAAAPHRRARVYNVPPEPAIYRPFLEAGIDLIGVKDLRRGQQALAALDERHP
jgi:hypothetical protein